MPFDGLVRVSNIYYGESIPSEFKKVFDIAEALNDFCATQQYSFTETARAFTSISATGSENTHRRAMNKIKDDIRTNLPNLKSSLIKFLKEKRIVNQEANIITTF